MLIRHAHAKGRKDWSGPDEQRPLSGKGRRQAQSLAKRLDEFAPQRILSSRYLRCVQTVEPLSSRIGVRVELADELAEGSGAAALDLVRAVANEKVALCTHGDVIPEILVGLADDDGLDLGPSPRQAKGSVWLLEANCDRFVRARYLAPVS